MRAVVYCFSGTGNTLRASEALAREWLSLGHEADICSLTVNDEPLSPDGYDRVIVAYPVHAFNAPAPVLKFLKRLKKGGEKVPSYLLRTSGEPLKFNHASGITLKRILKRKGYPVRGEFAFVMPYNIIFKHSEGMAARMDRAMQLQLPEAARTIERGEGNLFKNNAWRRLVSFVLRIERPAMPAIGISFRAAKACVGCGVCAKSCPQGNIRIKNGKAKFGGHCVGCMACSFSCPRDAVRPSILNGWRVNGAYNFDGVPATDGEVCKYCRKAYLRYFHECEEKNESSVDQR